jgi:hypothetical protein
MFTLVVWMVVAAAAGGCSHTPKWEAMYRDGKEEGLFTFPARPLAYYQANILPVPGETQWSLRNGRLRVLTSKAWDCGTVNGRRVVEVWSRIAEDNGYYNSAKLILLETNKGQFRPVYHLLDRENEPCRLNAVVSGGTVTIRGCGRPNASAHMKADAFDISTVYGVK